MDIGIQLSQQDTEIENLRRINHDLLEKSRNIILLESTVAGLERVLIVIPYVKHHSIKQKLDFAEKIKKVEKEKGELRENYNQLQELLNRLDDVCNLIIMLSLFKDNFN